MWILFDKGTNLKSFRVKFKLCVDSTRTCTPWLMQQHCSRHRDDYHAVLKSLGVLSERFYSPLSIIIILYTYIIWITWKPEQLSFVFKIKYYYDDEYLKTNNISRIQVIMPVNWPQWPWWRWFMNWETTVHWTLQTSHIMIATVTLTHAQDEWHLLPSQKNLYWISWCTKFFVCFT
jgi:hypothetical protein